MDPGKDIFEAIERHDSIGLEYHKQYAHLFQKYIKPSHGNFSPLAYAIWCKWDKAITALKDSPKTTTRIYKKAEHGEWEITVNECELALAIERECDDKICHFFIDQINSPVIFEDKGHKAFEHEEVESTTYVPIICWALRHKRLPLISSLFDAGAKPQENVIRSFSWGRKIRQATPFSLLTDLVKESKSVSDRERIKTCAYLLLRHHVDINTLFIDHDKHATALEGCAGNLEMLRFFIETCNGDVRAARNALCRKIAKEGSTEEMIYVLSKGADEKEKGEAEDPCAMQLAAKRPEIAKAIWDYRHPNPSSILLTTGDLHSAQTPKNSAEEALQEHNFEKAAALLTFGCHQLTKEIINKLSLLLTSSAISLEEWQNYFKEEQIKSWSQWQKGKK